MKRLSLLVFLLFFGLFSNKMTAQGNSIPLFDSAYVHDITVRFEQENWDNMLDSMRIYGDGMLMATVIIDGVEYKEVGVGYRGNSSYQMASKRNPMQLKLNYVRKEQNHQGIKSIKLSNALRDPSLVREVLGFEIARKYMSAPRADYANVSINGENRGIYINVESIGEDFLQNHFGSADGPLFKPKANYKVEAPEGCDASNGALRVEKKLECYQHNFTMYSKEGWEDLMELTRVLKETPAKISSVLNVDRTLWLLAYNNVLVNLSSYSGSKSENYYLYKDKTGHFTPILWDLNLNFGGLKNTGVGSDLDLKGVQELDPLMNADNASKPLISQLLANPEYKKIYISHLRQIMKDCYEGDWYSKRAAELQKLVRPYFNIQNEKGGYTVADFDKSMTTTIGNTAKIPGISELMSARIKFLKKLPLLGFVAPKVSEVAASNRKKFAKEKITEFHIKAKVENFPKKVLIYYRSAESEAYQVVEMKDDGKSHDGRAGDKIFGVAINPQGKFSKIEYYIVAENQTSISFEPSNYMFVKLKSSLEEMNK
jgi:CotH kinase protein